MIFMVWSANVYVLLQNYGMGHRFKQKIRANQGHTGLTCWKIAVG